ncbi:MAG: flagellar basal-body rod protein FlgF [Rhodospirillaceae bacterium]|jgi:flagellar basal-body rod protein FlgF|nr:flagellar basal-body rod protein FlgF [Rhodospirillaceae bacterium]
METTSYIALSRQTALRRQMDVVANNIANMNTSGFKGERMMFVEHLVKSKGGERILGDKVSYTRDISTMRDLSEGPLEQTGNPLDVAITGDGYFMIQTDTGNHYTRNGRFQLDEGGQMVTQAGDPVLSDGGQPFFFAPGDTNISVGRDGTVSTSNGDLGRLAVVTFENQHQMRPSGGGLFAIEAEAKPVEKPTVVQGMLEGSNIQPVVEMSRLIHVQRTYESVRNFLEKEDERQLRMVRDLAATN